MVVDDETSVPLSTEVLDGRGRVFRMAALVTLSPGAPEAPEMPEMEMMGTARTVTAPEALPAEVAGYVRADVYDGGEQMIQAFYTDGLFSFSVFESPRTGRPAAFDLATEFLVSGHAYRRIVAPTTVWVHWNAPDRTYVLVGDLPPDHLARVLGDLPEPGQRNWLVRLWRRLFG
jgi:negative regulator of sigma E activity